MKKRIAVSIILVNYNGADVLPSCLKSLERFLLKENCEIILVDNASTDGSPNLVAEKFPFVKLIKLTKNLGFGAGNNAGAKVAKGEFLFLLNTDTILTSNILPHLIELMYVRSDVGIIGPKLLNPDGSLQISFSPAICIKGESQARKMHHYAQKKSNLKLIEREYQEIKELDIVVGAAFFIRANLFHQLGGFDENFFMYFEESDLCQRVQNLGYKILYTPHISLIHIKGHTIKKLADAMAVEYRRSQLYYYQKHRPIWENLLVRIYLFYKLFWEFIITRNFYCLKIVSLLVIYHPYLGKNLSISIK